MERAGQDSRTWEGHLSLPEGLLYGLGHGWEVLHRGEDVKASRPKVPRLKEDTEVETTQGAHGLEGRDAQLLFDLFWGEM